MMSLAALDGLPGFRRRFRITPQEHRVCSEVEDDFHCMRVSVRHDGSVARQIDAEMLRAPWNTCPGAAAVLRETFTDVPLRDFGTRGNKRNNCTHLHDLAVLAAAHAHDRERLVYDVLVSDPVDGCRRAELRRNGRRLLAWTEKHGVLTEPAEVAGRTLFDLGEWIGGLEPERQEAARILRWGSLVSHGRTIPLEQQSDATQMPVGNCYTFQPHIRTEARRIGAIRDFSVGSVQPLDRCGA